MQDCEWERRTHAGVGRLHHRSDVRDPSVILLLLSRAQQPQNPSRAVCRSSLCWLSCWQCSRQWAVLVIRPTQRVRERVQACRRSRSMRRRRRFRRPSIFETRQRVRALRSRCQRHHKRGSQHRSYQARPCMKIRRCPTRQDAASLRINRGR